ncbi:unnamed protein product [Penicillium camemberti]|uniref:Str. FM013 n=1 Tax=Penicillium camemberti (strain FM 013) TaxID=1429867 RepID=A0A0G4PJI8_PENC3|nr:unnamed protein product [Penicillium camemberti]
MGVPTVTEIGKREREIRHQSRGRSMKADINVLQERERGVTYTETYLVQELRWKMIHSA